MVLKFLEKKIRILTLTRLKIFDPWGQFLTGYKGTFSLLTISPKTPPKSAAEDSVKEILISSLAFI